MRQPTKCIALILLSCLASVSGNQPNEGGHTQSALATNSLTTFLQKLQTTDPARNWREPLAIRSVQYAAGEPPAPSTTTPVPPEVGRTFQEWLSAALGSERIPQDLHSEMIGLQHWIPAAVPQRPNSDAIVVSFSSGPWRIVALQTLSRICLVVRPIPQGTLSGPGPTPFWLNLLDHSVRPKTDPDGRPLPWPPGEVFSPRTNERSGLAVSRDERTGLQRAFWSLGSDYPFALSSKAIWDTRGHAVIVLHKRYHRASATVAVPRGRCLVEPSPLATRAPWYGHEEGQQATATEWNALPMRIELYSDPLQFQEGHYAEPFLTLAQIPDQAQRMSAPQERRQELRATALGQIRDVLRAEWCPGNVERLIALYVEGQNAPEEALYYRTKYVVADRKFAIWGTIDQRVNLYVEPAELGTASEFRQFTDKLLLVSGDLAVSRRGGEFVGRTHRARITTLRGYRREFDRALGQDVVQEVTAMVARFHTGAATPSYHTP